MRRFLLLPIVVLLILGIAGCPWLPLPNRQFTSADRFGGRNVGVFGDAGSEGEGEVEGDAPAAAQRDVVEPDVIRQDGDLLYVLNQYRGLSIVDLAGESVLAQLPTFGYPRDLYLVDSRAYVLVGYARQAVVEGNVVRVDVGSRLYVADVSDPANASVVASFDLEGDLIDSRLVGDVLYAVGARYSWAIEGDVVMKEQTSESWVTSIAVGDPENIAVVDSLGIPGIGNTIQVSSEAIFVASADWYSDNGDVTTISYIDISDPSGIIATGGSVNVPGYIADRFKLDAWNGVLRVVSNTRWPSREVYVTTVDLADPQHLAILGQTALESASGEALFAVRFDGPRAYVVTYLVVDPLFIIDLADPAHPNVAGELMVPGWSTHIEIVHGRLVALGVDDTDGRQVKVSLYDVDDPQAPAEVDTVSFGSGWAWSSAFSDVKAFTVLDDMLIVPTSGWEEATGRFDRLQFISYDPGHLALRGTVDVQGDILRSFRHGDQYYGVTTEQVAVIDAADPDAPSVVNTITLAEYLYDYFELSDTTNAAVVARTERNEVAVRTETAGGDMLGEITVHLAGIIAAEATADRVALVGTNWDAETYESTYRVVIVDVSDPAAPAVLADLSSNVAPWWNYWWGCYDCWGPEVDVGMGMEERTKQFADMFYMPWFGGEDSALLAGDYLVLRGQADSYDVTFGDGRPEQGLLVVDLASGAITHTIGLGFEQVISVNTAGGRIYLGTKETLGVDVDPRPQCALYISELDLDGPSLGVAANVPGTFVQYAPETGVLLLQDWQYDGGFMEWNVTQSLRTVIWEGGDTETVMAVDEYVLPDYAGSIVGAGSRAYYQYYDGGSIVASIRVSPMGLLSDGGSLPANPSGGYLLAAKESTAFLSMGNAIATYDFTATPTLTDLTETMGWPSHVRFGTHTAYAPLGYAGLATLPY